MEHPCELNDCFLESCNRTSMTFGVSRVVLGNTSLKT